jgi:hypothetical protein
MDADIDNYQLSIDQLPIDQLLLRRWLCPSDGEWSSGADWSSGSDGDGGGADHSRACRARLLALSCLQVGDALPPTTHELNVPQSCPKP